MRGRMGNGLLSVSLLLLAVVAPGLVRWVVVPSGYVPLLD